MGAKKVTLKSSDGVVLEVEEAVALESEVIKHMIEDNCANDVIPLPNVTSYILSKVIKYCKKLVELEKPGEDNNPPDEDLKSWVADFVKVDGPTLLDLQTAADYLDITGLKELTLLVVGDMINGKTPNEICKTFDIEIPYCFPEPEEEEEEEVTIKAEKVGLNKVTLKSSDGQVFEVKVAVALESQTIMKHMIEVESVDADGAILLPNITSNILSMVIEYREKHVEMQKRGDNEDWDDRIWEKRGDWVEWHLRFWDENFMLVNRTAFHGLLGAARYLKIGSLLDLTLEVAAGVVIYFKGVEEERRLLALMHF